MTGKSAVLSSLFSLVLALVLVGCSDDGGTTKEDTGPGTPDTIQSDTVMTPDGPLADIPTVNPDTTVDMGQQPEAGPDMGMPDAAADMAMADVGGTDMVVADAPSGDAAAIGPGCSSPTPVTLTGTTTTVNGDTSGLNNNEFGSGLDCNTSDDFPGSQLYYQVSLVGGTSYVAKVKSDGTWNPVLYAFPASTTCNTASINPACANTVSDESGDTTVEPVAIQPTQNEDWILVVDSDTAADEGAFTLIIEEFTPPTNDTCQTAETVTLSGTTTTVSGVKVGATNALANCGTATMGATDLWYKFTPASGKAYKVTFKPDGTGGRFGVWDGNHNCVDSAVETECGKLGYEYVSGGSSSSTIIIPSSGDVYFVADGLSSSYDFYTFVFEIEEIPIPTNTQCSSAQTVTLTGGKATVTGDTTLSTDEFSTLQCQTVGSTSTTSNLDGAQLYYKFAATANQWYKLTLSPNDTSQYLYVFTSTACTETAIQTDCQSGGTSGSAIGSVSSGDTEALYFKAPATGDVYFAVDSTYGDGAFTVNIEEFTAPTNGTCANAQTITLTGGKATVTGDTDPTLTPDEFSTLLCGTSSSAFGGPQVYYSVALTANQDYQISLTADAAYGIYAYLFSDTCTEATIQTDCQSAGTSGNVTSSAYSGDTETMIFTPTTSGTYKIAVDSKSNSSFGGFTLVVEEITLPGNNTCANAQALTFTSGAATVNGDTTLATDTHSMSMSACTGYSSPGPDLFYSVDLTANQQYTVTLTPDSNYDPSLYVFTDCTQPENTCLTGGGSDNFGSGVVETVTITPTTTGTYLIGVDSYSSSQFGTFTLEVK